MDCTLDNFKDNLEQLKLLFPIHWQEAKFDEDNKLDMNYEVYLKAEENGSLIFISLKDKEKLIGYFTGLVYNSLHCKNDKWIMQDLIFVHPDYRKKFGGIKLLKKLEEISKQLGVKRILLCSRSHLDISPIFKKMGYKIGEIYYTKTIGN